MLDLLLIASLLVLYLLGLACLALAQDKHWKTLNLCSQRQAWVVPIGWGSLALSLLLAWAYQGVAFGSLMWVLLLPPSGYVMVFILAWRPQWLRPLARLLSR
ncbi:DUF3325 family protein [Stutzerimonas stutzeri]|nr:DUF3325 family protein [Stutzerimonas stutzeri]MCQ4261800.1 DUF3325 domain-containing protein [Stutzerimonas stutzeri]